MSSQWLINAFCTSWLERPGAATMLMSSMFWNVKMPVRSAGSAAAVRNVGLVCNGRGCR